MNTLRKSLVVAVAALSLGGIAIAAPGPGTPGQSDSHWGDSAQNGEKFAARMAKRQAALHDKLALTPAQEGAWQVFTAKVKATLPVRPAAGSTATLTAPERADRMAANLQTAQQQAATRAQAVKEFYAVLSPDQQKTFDSQFHGHRHHHH
jgi:protein CpxP